MGMVRSLLCLISNRLGAILWHSELLSSCVCFLILIHTGGVDPLGVFLLFPQKVTDIITPKLSIIFRRLIRLGSFSECWSVCQCNCHSQGCSIA